MEKLTNTLEGLLSFLSDEPLLDKDFYLALSLARCKRKVKMEAHQNGIAGTVLMNVKDEPF